MEKEWIKNIFPNNLGQRHEFFQRTMLDETKDG